MLYSLVAISCLIVLSNAITPPVLRPTFVSVSQTNTLFPIFDSAITPSDCNNIFDYNAGKMKSNCVVQTNGSVYYEDFILDYTNAIAYSFQGDNCVTATLDYQICLGYCPTYFSANNFTFAGYWLSNGRNLEVWQTTAFGSTVVEYILRDELGYGVPVREYLGEDLEVFTVSWHNPPVIPSHVFAIPQGITCKTVEKIDLASKLPFLTKHRASKKQN